MYGEAMWMIMLRKVFRAIENMVKKFSNNNLFSKKNKKI
jgi:hypothetical protein